MDKTTLGCMFDLEHNFEEGRNMMVGLLGLGMLLGTITGAVALIAGQSFLTALWLYISVGTVSTLAIAVALYAFSGRQRCFDEAAATSHRVQ